MNVMNNISTAKSPIYSLLSKIVKFTEGEYTETTFNDFKSRTPLPPIYTFETENKTVRIAKSIISYVIFPIALYKLFHRTVAKKFFLPSSSASQEVRDGKRDTCSFEICNQYANLRCKRISVMVDDYQIDGMLIIKPTTFNNKRWVLASCGNGEHYEDKIHDGKFGKFLSALESNAVVFNYPGVGSSTGPAERQAMVKAYKVMYRFLEDQKNGIGASQVIGYGYSIGGGVQGDFLNTDSPTNRKVKTVWVKIKSFRDIAAIAQEKFPGGGILSKLSGWNISSIESSRKLKHPEIIIQTAKTDRCIILDKRTNHLIIDDGLISPEASLGKSLLEDSKVIANKVFIGVPGNHSEPFPCDIRFLTDAIKSKLAAS